MEAQVEQIHATIIKFEDPVLEEEKKQQVLAWFKNITDPQFQLIDSLIVMFIDNSSNLELSRKILKILRKLNEIFPENVGPQFFQNLKFPRAIVKYFEVTQLEEMTGDAFILLINVFDEKRMGDTITLDFVNKVTSSLPFIEDDSTLHPLVSILVCLLPLFEKRSEDPDDITKNPVLNEFVTKEQFYREKLIYLVNRGGIYRLDKCCKALNILLSKPDLASYYFNTNDINLILDILLREAQSNAEAKTRVQVLRLMETILDNPVYREYKHRFEDVEEMVVEQILYEDDDQEKKMSASEMECIASLNQFFQVEKRKAALAS